MTVVLLLLLLLLPLLIDGRRQILHDGLDHAGNDLDSSLALTEFDG